jgi:hypothetical protein
MRVEQLIKQLKKLNKKDLILCDLGLCIVDLKIKRETIVCCKHKNNMFWETKEKHESRKRKVKKLSEKQAYLI